MTNARVDEIAWEGGGGVGAGTGQAASEQSGDNLKGFDDLNLEAQARIWP